LPRLYILTILDLGPEAELIKHSITVKKDLAHVGKNIVEHEFIVAHLAGWRTFRVRLSSDPLLVISPRRGSNRVPLEFVCPASDEAEHRATCQQCQLCRGTSSPARSVTILAHGKPSTLRAFGIRVPMFGRRVPRGTVRHLSETYDGD